MKRLRWLLAFLFFCAVDFANPLAAVPHESHETVEEGIHLAGHRRVSRVEAPDRRPARLAPRLEVGRRPAMRIAAHRQRTTPAPERKVPPPLADSQSSARADDPDAH